MTRELSLATKDNEVMDISAVQVQLTETQEQKSMITLAYINNQIAVITGQLQTLQARLVEFQGLRDEVTTLAKDVKLKVSLDEVA